MNNAKEIDEFELKYKQSMKLKKVLSSRREFAGIPAIIFVPFGAMCFGALVFVHWIYGIIFTVVGFYALYQAYQNDPDFLEIIKLKIKYNYETTKLEGSNYKQTKVRYKDEIFKK